MFSRGEKDTGRLGFLPLMSWREMVLRSFSSSRTSDKNLSPYCCSSSLVKMMEGNDC